MTRSLFILLIVFVSISCKSDKIDVESTVEAAPVSLDMITGDWEIYYATRNGKETKSLENGNFSIQGDNTIKSNLFSIDNSYSFTLDQNVISIDSEELINEMRIKSLSNDSLILMSKMKNYVMGFHLVRDSIQ